MLNYKRKMIRNVNLYKAFISLYDPFINKPSYFKIERYSLILNDNKIIGILTTFDNKLEIILKPEFTGIGYGKKIINDMFSKVRIQWLSTKYNYPFLKMLYDMGATCHIHCRDKEQLYGDLNITLKRKNEDIEFLNLINNYKSDYDIWVKNCLSTRKSSLDNLNFQCRSLEMSL